MTQETPEVDQQRVEAAHAFIQLARTIVQAAHECGTTGMPSGIL